MKMNYCTGCDQNFNGIGAFEKHRTGDYGDAIYEACATGKTQKVIGHTPVTRRCMTTEEMEAKGMVWSLENMIVTIEGQKSKQEVINWTLPMSDAERERMAKLR
jgi:hypothetical protein